MVQVCWTFNLPLAVDSLSLLFSIFYSFTVDVSAVGLVLLPRSKLVRHLSLLVLLETEIRDVTSF